MPTINTGETFHVCYCFWQLLNKIIRQKLGAYPDNSQISKLEYFADTVNGVQLWVPNASLKITPGIFSGYVSSLIALHGNLSSTQDCTGIPTKITEIGIFLPF